MKLHPNIEKSAWRKGEFVGYCNGCQRIKRGGTGWRTYELGSKDGFFVSVSAPTLYELGELLAHIQANNPAQPVC